MGDFDLRMFVSRDAGVGDGNSPERCRGEVRRLGDGIDECGFVADFTRDARVGLGEAEERDQEQQDSANLAQRLPRGGLKKILTAEDAEDAKKSVAADLRGFTRIRLSNLYLALLVLGFIRVNPCKSAVAFASRLLAQDCSSYIEVVTEES